MNLGKIILAAGLSVGAVVALACSSAAAPTEPAAPEPAAPAQAPSAQSAVAPAAPQAPEAAAPAPTAAPALPAPVPIVPTAFAQTAAPPRRSLPTPQPPSMGEPQGTVSIGVVDVGPPLYYGYKLAWPYSTRNVAVGLYESLTWFDGERMQPQIADYWELDGLALRLTIRDDVAFHDSAYGNVTAEDVIFTYENTSRDGTLHTRASPVQRDYSGFKIIDDATVEFTLRDEVVTWPVGPQAYGIESKARFEERGEEYTLMNSNGTGPFRLESHVTDDIMVLEAIRDHWRQTPDVARVRILELPESTTRVAALKTKQADAIFIDLPFIDQVSDMPGVQFVDGQYGSASGSSIFFAGQYYQTQHPRTGEPTNRTPLSHLEWVGDPNDPASMESAKNVRKAFAHAIDREGIIDEILGGRGCAQYQYRVDSCSQIWDDKWATPYDPDRSRELLTAAGYSDGFKFNYFIPSGVNSTMEEIAESLAPMFEAVGLRATIDKTAYSARRPTMLDRTIDDVWMFPHGSGITPDGIVQQWLEMGGEGVWNMGAEIPGASVAAQAVLYELDWEVAWQKIAQGLDWFYEWQPTAQAVTWRDPVATSSRISSWNMPTHPFMFPAYIENLQLSR